MECSVGRGSHHRPIFYSNRKNLPGFSEPGVESFCCRGGGDDSIPNLAYRLIEDTPPPLTFALGFDGYRQANDRFERFFLSSFQSRSEETSDYRIRNKTSIYWLTRTRIMASLLFPGTFTRKWPHFLLLLAVLAMQAPTTPTTPTTHTTHTTMLPDSWDRFCL
jgi:hypothetical protein